MQIIDIIVTLPDNILFNFTDSYLSCLFFFLLFSSIKSYKDKEKNCLISSLILLTDVKEDGIDLHIQLSGYKKSFVVLNGYKQIVIIMQGSKCLHFSYCPLRYVYMLILYVLLFCSGIVNSA